MKTAIEPLLTTADVAAILKCSQDHVASLYHAGKLPAAGLAVITPQTGRPGRRMLRFRPADVRDFIAAQTTTVETSPAQSLTLGPIVPATVGEGSLLMGGRKAKAKA